MQRNVFHFFRLWSYNEVGLFERFLCKFVNLKMYFSFSFFFGWRGGVLYAENSLLFYAYWPHTKMAMKRFHYFKKKLPFLQIMAAWRRWFLSDMSRFIVMVIWTSSYVWRFIMLRNVFHFFKSWIYNGSGLFERFQVLSIIEV